VSTVFGVGSCNYDRLSDCAAGLCYTLALYRLERAWPRGLWRRCDVDDRQLKSHVQLSFCSCEHFDYGCVAIFLTKMLQKKLKIKEQKLRHRRDLNWRRLTTDGRLRPLGHDGYDVTGQTDRPAGRVCPRSARAKIT